MSSVLIIQKKKKRINIERPFFNFLFCQMAINLKVIKIFICDVNILRFRPSSKAFYVFKPRTKLIRYSLT